MSIITIEGIIVHIVVAPMMNFNSSKEEHFTMAEVKRLKYFVNGVWKESKTTKYMPVTDSSTGKLIAEAPTCTIDEVNEAVAAAKAAFPAWSAKTVTARTQVMYRWKQLIEDNVDELSRICATELGKQLEESRGEILKIAEAAEVACSLPMAMQGSAMMEVTKRHDTICVREPLGVFACIAPFNFPGMIPFGWMLPMCITTGNTMVLKAASMVPMTGMRCLELLHEAGLPKGVVNFVTCSRKEADLLLVHPDIVGVSFVGSSSVGRHIYSTAAANGKRVQVLGEAKNHGIVLRDAAMERSAMGIINSSFGCAGMRCMALPVLCVENACADEFLRYFLEAAKKRVIGPAYEKETELGPVVSAEHKESVVNWIQKGVNEGAELLLDGRNVKVPGYEGGYYVGPTIFDHVTEEMTVGRDEIFGPVVCIKRVNNFEEALTIANSSKFANGSCIFTESGYYAREFAYRTHGGMVGINVGIPVPVSFFPFSGHKQSFYGDLHVLGRDGLAFYTESKTITTRWFSNEEKAQTKIGTWEGTSSKE
jgi:malonate-semialdehyde dehydrogenase (acetylating)/methylmalonate-semialdehyde dehydrogenase